MQPDNCEIASFLKFVRDEFCYDFTGYVSTSIKRRLAFALADFGEASCAALAQSLLRDRTRIGDLLGFLTIGTTELFRDPDFFLDFRKTVVPLLRTHPYPNVWVAGCSTGEEVIGYAIILAEEGLLDRTTVYASDVNPRNLQVAKDRIYAADSLVSASQAYQKAGGRLALKDYYEMHDDSVVFDKRLLKNVVFIDHCLVTDGVFSEFFYVSCRNVMIYFEAAARDRVLRLFRESLREGGILGVGSAEDLTITGRAFGFSPLHGKHFYRGTTEGGR